MISWVGLNFILVIYSNVSQLTYSLIGSLVMARRVIWISSVRSSVWKFSWNWLFSFFLELNMMLGANVVLCMTEPDFFKIIFCPKNGENRPSLGFFECLEKFSFSSQFFSFFFNFVIKVCIIGIAVCLNKFHIWQNSGSWDMKMLLANQIVGFFNQLQDSKTGCISQRN